MKKQNTFILESSFIENQGYLWIHLVKPIDHGMNSFHPYHDKHMLQLGSGSYHQELPRILFHMQQLISYLHGSMKTGTPSTKRPKKGTSHDL
jgi:hypothetical protein